MSLPKQNRVRSWSYISSARTLLRVSLAITCLLLLVPYFLSFREKLNPEYMLSRLIPKAKQQVRKNPDNKLDDVAKIHNFAMSAFVLKDYDTFDRSIESLTDLAYEACDAKIYENSKAVFERLSHIGIVTMEDPMAPHQVVMALVNICTRFLEKKLARPIAQASETLYYIGEVAIKKRLERISGEVISNLGSISSQALLVENNITVDINDNLGELGHLAVKNDMEDTVDQCSDILGNAGCNAISKGTDKEQVAFRATFCIGEVGVAAVGKGMKKATRSVENSLGAIGVNAAAKGFGDAAWRAAYDLGEVGVATVEKGWDDVANFFAPTLGDIGKLAAQNNLFRAAREAALAFI
ncbi:hypothetical protein ACFLYR_02650 [Chloroflexota bacterium]